MGLSKTRADVRVFLGPADGSEVDATDVNQLVTYLVPQEIARREGGERLDHADFLYDLSQTEEHVQNTSTPTGWNRQVEVRLWDAVAEEYTPMFWGDLTLQRLIVTNDSEQVLVTASIFPYHFGTTLRGPYQIGHTEEDVTLPEDITFNPNIDGVIEPNMAPASAPGGHRYWFDPEMARTTAAIDYHNLGGPPEMWTLEEATKALCIRCNEDEDFIKNPNDFSAFDDAIRPENIKMPPGRHLPFYLDALLHPYGYGWYVKLTDVGGTTEKRIAIFRRGEGTPQTVYMQPFGQTLELSEAEPSFTNVAHFDLTTDVGNVANKVRAYGGRKQYEITFELYRGWPEADDALDEADLDKSEEDSEYHVNGKTKVWRLWVANEAGDWNETRTTVAPIPAAPRDWSQFGVLVPRRRTMEHCLTLDSEGKRLRPQLEWTDGTLDESDEVIWKPVPDSWTFSFHQSQMAVEFHGDQPPPELITAGAAAKLRVTCTLTGDERIYADAGGEGRVVDPNTESPNGRTVQLDIDVSDRYFFREVVTIIDSDDYWSRISDGSQDTDERDDQDELQTFADYAMDEESAAQMGGRVVLVDVVTGIEIGDHLANISGREINLNRKSAAAGSPMYPQIMGIVWHPQQPEAGTELETHLAEVDPFYRPGARPDGEI